MVFCRNCGNELEGDVQFCAKCGTNNGYGHNGSRTMIGMDREIGEVRKTVFRPRNIIVTVLIPLFGLVVGLYNTIRHREGGVKLLGFSLFVWIAYIFIMMMVGV